MKIRTFEDLVSERMRLESTFTTQKNELRKELKEIKEMFNPFTRLIKWSGGIQKMLFPSSIASVGANAGIDVLVRDKILSKSNWIVRTVVPFILKRFSNLFLGSDKKNNSIESGHVGHIK